MKKVITRLALLFCLIAPAMAVLSQSDDELKQMIESNNKMMGDAMKAGDIEKALVLYSDDAVQLPNNAKMLNGIAEIRKDQEEMVKEGWKVKEYTTKIQSVESHGDIVTEIGTYTIGLTKEGTTDMLHREGKYLTMWKIQTDGSLKIKTEMWNHDQNYELMAATEKMGKDPMMKDKDMKDKSKMSEDKSIETEENK